MYRPCPFSFDTGMSTTKPFSGAVVALVLTGLAFALHASVFGLSFFSDDFSVIHRVGVQGDLGTGSFFRPLPDWTLYLNYHVAGPSPTAFRVVNVLLLGFNGWLVYQLGRNLLPHGESASPALISALLFVCYPFHNEPQLWIIGRSTIMSTSFVLLALIAASGRNSRLFRCVAVGICGWLGAMCYELALLLPILLLVLMVVVHPGERRTWWQMTLVSAGVVAVNLFLRSMLTGNVANDYGTSFFAHGILSYFAMGAKILGRLFLPPHPDERIQLIRFAVLNTVLLVFVFLLFRRTRYERNARILLLVLAGLTAVACGIGIIGGVSTRTSESDRFLYLPSAFLCMLVALSVTMLTRGKVRIGVVIVLLVASIFAMNQNHANWVVASRTIERIVHETPAPPAEGRLFVSGLPGDHNGAFIFRHGFREALLFAGRDTARIEVAAEQIGNAIVTDRGDTLMVTTNDRIWRSAGTITP